MQEKKSKDAYGEILGRLICFYLRWMEIESNSEYADEDLIQWFDGMLLDDVQRHALRKLNLVLDSSEENENTIERAFHEALKAMFCWLQDRVLLNDTSCPVQRFLIVLCLRKQGDGFIHVKSGLKIHR